MKLTVYGGTYDGRNRVIVAAKTKKQAYEAINAAINVGSYSTWDKYTADSGNEYEVKVAMSRPLTVYTAPDRSGGKFVALETQE